MNDLHTALLNIMGGDTCNLLGLEQTTEERWGGLDGFGRAYEAADADFVDLCIGDSAFCDGIDLGFAWGLMTAFANLHGMDVGTACRIGAEVLKQEEQS
jgi:hypothetical protein